MTTPTARKPIASPPLDADNPGRTQKTHGDAGWDRYGSHPRSSPPGARLPRRPRPDHHGGRGTRPSRENREALASLAGRRATRSGTLVSATSPWLFLRARRSLSTGSPAPRTPSPRGTGKRTIGFRGPHGWPLRAPSRCSWKGYRYDASTPPAVMRAPPGLSYSGRPSSPEQMAERLSCSGTWATAGALIPAVPGGGSPTGCSLIS